jgi:serine/threonine-protein kinase
MEAGQTIAGKYRLNRLLGTGGMASVWSATNVFTEREFAMKFMLPQVARTPEAARRFLLEAKVSARINHPNIIEVIDVGQAEDGSLFLVMELLSGASLDVAIRRQKPPMLVYEFLLIMREVAQALAAAHRSGVIHRDLKPTNIFLHKDRDGRVVPKILDFGVSKILEDEMNTALTIVGTVLGSPLYMSPEQAMGAEGIDGRTDVFAFGSIMFESLSGKRAFDAPNFNALIVTIATTQPQSIDDAGPQLPAPIRSLISECIVTDKTKRIESFDLICDRLDAMLPELVHSEMQLPSPHGEAPPSDPDATDALRVIRTSDRPPGPTPGPAHGSSVVAVHMSNPPPALPAAPAPISGGWLGGWLQRAEAVVHRLPGSPRGRTAYAVGAGGLVVLVGVIVGVTAAFSSSEGSPQPAAAGTAISAISGGAAASKIAIPAASTSASSEVPVISVDSLPVAPRGASAGKGNGRLTIVSGPGSCAVSVDGVSHGSTPLASLEVTAGVHRVDCVPAGGKPKSTSVAVVEGAATRYNFALDE